jgi:tetrahydromethanopterin S-methyltransferase subunit G
MGVVEDVRQVVQDFVSPDIRAIEARLSALEKKVDENERRAENRHAETMQAIRDVANYTNVMERLARLEAERKPAA